MESSTLEFSKLWGEQTLPPQIGTLIRQLQDLRPWQSMTQEASAIGPACRGVTCGAEICFPALGL